MSFGENYNIKKFSFLNNNLDFDENIISTRGSDSILLQNINILKKYNNIFYLRGPIERVYFNKYGEPVYYDGERIAIDEPVEMSSNHKTFRVIQTQTLKIDDLSVFLLNNKNNRIYLYDISESPMMVDPNTYQQIKVPLIRCYMEEL